jgi:formate dehydrogenase major subunit
MSRRQFLKVTATSLAGSSLALLGFSPTQALAEVRQYKLARTSKRATPVRTARSVAAS